MNQNVFPLLTAIVLSVTFLTAQDDFKPVTQLIWTEPGFVRGKTNGTVDQFLGIPYAAPPTGGLRWRPPAPPPRWYGIRDATQFGSQCTQLAPVKATGPSANVAQSVTGSENCLFLNIYRPAKARPRQLLPVMVFMHGGSNEKGSANDYDPTKMVAKTGIIVVTLNYRLNVFGFLALPALDAEAHDPSSGNFGVLDQQAAMHWVHANILAFGGDPLNVTLAGESSGGIDVCASLSSPRAAGLFHRAILESMYCPTASHAEALTVSNPIAVKLGCSDAATAAACLRAKTPADVLQAAGTLSGTPGGGPGFNASPNSGNAILPLPPTDALRAGQWNWSAILVGSNHDEAALMVAPAFAAHGVKLPFSAQAYQYIVDKRFGSFAPEVLGEYPIDHYKDAFFAYADMATDKSLLGCPASPMSDLFSSLTQTFRYEFDDPNAPLPTNLANVARGLNLGAYHGSELQYLFKMTSLAGAQTPAQQQLSDQMIQYWGNFVKTGDPNGSGLARWPRYDPAARQLLSLRPTGNVVINNFDTDHHCAFWAAAPPSTLAPFPAAP